PARAALAGAAAPAPVGRRRAGRARRAGGADGLDPTLPGRALPQRRPGRLPAGGAGAGAGVVAAGARRPPPRTPPERGGRGPGSLDVAAAVNLERRPGDHRRLVRGEPERGAGQVLRGVEPAERDRLDEAPAGL